MSLALSSARRNDKHHDSYMALNDDTAGTQMFSRSDYIRRVRGPAGEPASE